MQTTDQRMMMEADGLVTVRKASNTQDRKNFNLDTIFELPAVADFIIGLPAPEAPSPKNNNKKHLHVALQFPDSMLGYTVRIVERIQTLLVERGRDISHVPAAGTIAGTGDEAPIKMFVLADNTYGDCCPDEVTAEHYYADCIIHFGYACLSKSVRFPIHYVFAKMANFKVAEAAQQVVAFYEQNKEEEDVVVVMSPATVHHQEELTKAIRNLGAHIHVDGAAGGEQSTGSVLMADFSVPYSQLPGGAVCAPCCSSGGCGSTQEDQLKLKEEEIKKEVDEPVVAEALTTTSGEVSRHAAWRVNGFKIPKQRGKLAQKIFFVGPTDSNMLHQLSLISMHNEMVLRSSKTIEFLRVLDNAGWDSAAASSAPTTFTTLAASQVGATTQEIPSATEAAKQSTLAVNKRVRQRMFNMESLKKAQSVGIIVASLAIEGFKETAEKLRALLIKHKKRCYIIFIGHLSPLKTGNFVDSIDCFVTIACPNARMAQFTEKKDEFLQPMLSPIEVLLTFGYIDFEHPLAFSTDFSNVLNHDTSIRPKKQTDNSDSEEEDDSDAEDAGAAAITGGRGGQLVTTRPLNVAIAGGTAGSSLERFSERDYQGLEVRHGETQVQTEIVKGKHGIARGYETTEVAEDDKE